MVIEFITRRDSVDYNAFCLRGTHLIYTAMFVHSIKCIINVCIFNSSSTITNADMRVGKNQLVELYDFVYTYLSGLFIDQYK